MISLIGKLHPVLVHFPIAALILALAFAFAARKNDRLKHAIRPLYIIGACAALAAVGTGWAFAEDGAFFGRAAQSLEWHRWLGVGTAACACLVIVFAREKRPAAPVNVAMLAVAASLVGVTAHYGGILVHGEDHWVISDAPPKRALGDPAGVKRAGTDRAPFSLDSLPEKVSHDEVAPIFRRSCLRCHDARKRKGDLRLDRKQFAMAGGESGVVIQPGKSAESLLYKLISLPRDDEDYMPSKGEPLSEAEIAVIGRWIDQGAVWDER